MIWLFVLLLLIFSLFGLYSYFYMRRVLRFWGIKTKLRLLSAVAALLACLCIVLQMRSMLSLLLLHSFFISLLCDLLHLPVRRFPKVQRVYLSGLLPLIISVLAIGIGYFRMHDIQATHYTVETDALQLRIAFLSDLHYPNAMEPERLQRYCDEISQTQPDLIVLGGDIVDEGTSDAEIAECFAILGSMESTYGCYFISGNHDNADEITDILEANGITYLADESVSVGGLTLIGRRDRMDSRRVPLKTLLPAQADFVLVLDHQPLAAEEAAALGCDLVLSGHTHNGQIWPLGYINALLGPRYGRYTFGETELIVSSGIVGWAYPVRTQGVSEYVIIDLK